MSNSSGERPVTVTVLIPREMADYLAPLATNAGLALGDYLISCALASTLTAATMRDLPDDRATVERLWEQWGVAPRPGVLRAMRIDDRRKRP